MSELYALIICLQLVLYFTCRQYPQKIDEPVEEPPVIPPKTDPPTLSHRQKPSWEKYILIHLVIDTLDEKEGHCCSLTLKVELQTKDTGETKSVMALLDSGATGMFIDQNYVKASRLTTRTFSNPIPSQSTTCMAPRMIRKNTFAPRSV